MEEIPILGRNFYLGRGGGDSASGMNITYADNAIFTVALTRFVETITFAAFETA